MWLKPVFSFYDCNPLAEANGNKQLQLIDFADGFWNGKIHLALAAFQLFQFLSKLRLSTINSN